MAGVDRGDIKLSFNHYNLPFFFGLSRSMNLGDWTNLVGKIGTMNESLGFVLGNINKVIAGIERLLIQEHPLPLKRTADLSLPEPHSATNPPSIPGVLGPPPIPLSHRKDRTDDSTVGKKRKI